MQYVSSFPYTTPFQIGIILGLYLNNMSNSIFPSQKSTIALHTIEKVFVSVGRKMTSLPV